MCLVSFALALRKRQWISALVFATCVSVLSLAGSRLSSRMLASLERPYAAVNLDSLPLCDALVVLGGAAGPVEATPFRFDLNERADRAVTAMELMRRGKAKTLVFGGGGGKTTDGGVWREGILLEGWARSWGLALTNMFSLEVCANTYEEALQFRALASQHQWKNVILVTSASHMRRSEALFLSQGIVVIPVAADFQGLSELSRGRPFRITPLLENVINLQAFIHERIGWWYYSIRGRVQ